MISILIAGEGEMLTYLNEILSFRLGDQRLKLWCREGVDQTRLGHDQKQYLGTSEDREFVSLSTIHVSKVSH